MKTDVVFDEDGKGFTRSFSMESIERVNPVEYFKMSELKSRAIMLQDIAHAYDPFLTAQLTPDFFLKQALETMKGFFEKIEQTDVNPNLEKVLTVTKKKEQESLLKGVSFNPDELMSFIFKAYNKHQYPFSRYIFGNLPNGLEKKKMPKVIRLKEECTIQKVGDTDLTEGEMKNVIQHRKVIVDANFFDKGDVWHCFFITYNSIGGKESWKNGQAHFHYISSAFGVSREDFIESMRSGNYRSKSIHIDLLDYGNQANA